MKRLGIVFLLTCVLLCACHPNTPTIAPTQPTTTTTVATVTTTTPTTTTTIITTTSTTKCPVTKPPAPSADAVLVKNVPYISQLGKYPTGCESVSAVMALQYWGYTISVDTFIDNHLPRGSMPRKSGGKTIGADPWEEFIGNPRSTAGYGCFSPVIYRAVSAVIGSDHEVSQLSGLSLPQLCEQYIQNGIPVLIWATAGMRRAFVSAQWEATSGKQIEWKSPMHCLLLVGYDDKYYYFHDPQVAANTRYSRSACETVYAALGKQAVVICPKPTTTVAETTTVTTTTETATIVTVTTTTVTTFPVSSASTGTTTAPTTVITTTSATAAATTTTSP